MSSTVASVVAAPRIDTRLMRLPRTIIGRFYRESARSTPHSRILHPEGEIADAPGLFGDDHRRIAGAGHLRGAACGLIVIHEGAMRTL